MKGNNQISARNSNIETILRALTNEYLSSSDLAKLMSLTKPALTKIINEMLELNLIEITDRKKCMSNGAGRKKVFYKICPSAGLIGAIDFGSTFVGVHIMNLDGQILEEYRLNDAEFLNYDMLEHVSKEFLKMKTKFETDSMKLLTVCISTPGRINKYTQEMVSSPKFSSCKDLKIKDYFENSLKAPIFIKNDINLAILGEKNKGYIDSSVEDAVLLYIDSGIGGAIINKGKLVEGEDGFAGEFGLIKSFDKFGNLAYIDNLCSINAIKNHLRYLILMGDKVDLKPNFKYKDVVEAYFKKDNSVVDTINFSAKNIAIVIGNTYNTLNCHNFYISGRIRDLKEGFIDEVKKQLDNSEINVHYAKLRDDASLVGAIEVAQIEAFKTLVTNRKK